MQLPSRSKERYILRHKYFIYLPKTNTTVFTIHPVINQAKSTSLAPSMAELAHLAMLFIFQ